MSWRILVLILMLAAGFSTWGGISAGHWLVAHAPEAPPLPELLDDENDNILDADGKPYVAQAPQPLVNGTLGVPETPEPIEWEITEKSLVHSRFSSPISIGTNNISMEDAIDIAQGDGITIAGMANVGDLLNRDGNQAIQPIDIPNIANPQQTQENNNWQQALRQDLEACKAQGFFSRPTCAWNARNKYCGPNNAWGSIPECPAKN